MNGVNIVNVLRKVAAVKPPSFKDPARFSFAHGGKDGHPFPVDVRTDEESIEFLKACLDKARIGDRDKLDAFKKLSSIG